MSEDLASSELPQTDLARRWYIPYEMELMRRGAILVILISLPMFWIASLRGDGWQTIAMGLTGGLLAVWALQQKNRDIMLVSSALILFSGLMQAFFALEVKVAAIDVWYSTITVALGGGGLWVLSSPHMSRWLSSRLELEEAERGLARNNKLSPRWKAATTHAILLHFVVIVLVPIIWIIDVAFSPGQSASGELGISDWTITHFDAVLSGSDFWTWGLNSVIVSIGTTMVGLMLAIPAGYAFSRYKFSGHGIMMFSLLLVQMFPGIIILVPYFMVMKTLGLLNTSLGLILAYSVTALPFCVWMLKGWFDTIPRELEEAAALDGCTTFSTFWRIILPLSLPAIAVTALFSFLAAWNEFLLALVFNTDSSMYTLPVGLASYISEASARWGDFAAMSLIVSLPVVLLFIIFQKSLIQGLSSGSVKG